MTPKEKEPEFVYKFMYNSDCCEGCASTISIHKTKKGAKTAMEFHKACVKRAWEDSKIPEKEKAVYPFDYDQWWGVHKCELLP